jgi:integrase/recombinase XerD
MRYLVYRGLCDKRLINAVPSIPHWRLARLPKSLTKQQCTSLLDAFNQSTPFGLRDYAVTLCLLRLGIRANEVSALSFDDIDWRKGILRVHHCKGHRVNLLPISTDLGQAITNYIRHGRPPSRYRNVFIQHRPPIGEPIKSCTVQAIIRRAFRRSGISIISMGSHVLRHTVATQMVCSGASIKEVADILGHRSINTTCIYAKVDFPSLAAVALPWPEVK